MKECGGRDVDSVIEQVAQAILGQREEFIRHLSAEIRTRVPTLGTDARLRELMEAGTNENLTAALEFLRSGGDEQEVRAPEQALTYARALARNDIPASALIRAYRIGQAGFLDVAMRYAVELGSTDTPAVIMRIVHRTSTYIDQVSEQVGIAHEQEHERWVGSRGGLRQRWVTRLLDGSAIDIGDAEKALQYPLTGHHLAATAWTDPHIGSTTAAELLDQLRTALTGLFGQVSPTLLIPVDEHEARLWFSVPRDTIVDARAIDRALAARGLPVRVAFGRCATGVTGFRLTAGQAGRARQIALLGDPGRDRVISYTDVAATALLAGDLGTLREFVTDQLGALATDNERNQWLRETLRVFLARNNSYATTAQELTIHRNTVQYRVRQALNLIGSPDDGHDADLHLRLALQATHLLGPAVLNPAEISTKPAFLP
ncbi:PucR family transcriptional regulator [Nocardia carnea]|uniref:PucR family transcriptional regulator n=1 Tax=Nocardia carnea TaxID=37328 RepID=A0ABW7TYY1_9NOCA|nr:helix-turn-helix domain-containing protein [Nocardia carnea]